MFSPLVRDLLTDARFPSPVSQVRVWRTLYGQVVTALEDNGCPQCAHCAPLKARDRRDVAGYESMLPANLLSKEGEFGLAVLNRLVVRDWSEVAISDGGSSDRNVWGPHWGGLLFDPQHDRSVRARAANVHRFGANAEPNRMHELLFLKVVEHLLSPDDFAAVASFYGQVFETSPTTTLERW